MILRKTIIIILIFGVSLLFSCKAAKEQTSVNNSPKLEAIISTDKQKYQLGENISLYFEVKNNTKQTHSFCFWHTPFDNFTSDFLKINSNGKRINYIGKIVKRMPPTKADYIKLKPGESSKKVKIIINEGYQIVEKGTYKISFQGGYASTIENSNEIQFTIE
ncbi:MAG: hypothetical protein ACJAWV_003955 [Flammeovirgaceae bacterium]|jgi:hypothetical protein